MGRLARVQELFDTKAGIDFKDTEYSYRWNMLLYSVSFSSSVAVFGINTQKDVLKSRGSNAGKGHNCYYVHVFTNLLTRE